MCSLQMLISGGLVSAATEFEVVNPATGEVVAKVPQCSEDQLDDAFTAAAQAFPSWSGLSHEERRGALVGAADLIVAAREDLQALLVAELGKPWGEAGYEVDALVGSIRYYADLAISEIPIEGAPKATIKVVRRPFGVVAALTPWNASLSLLGEKMGSALAAGNTLVVKPSPFTPMSTLRVGEVLAEAFPTGVLNVVSGQEPLGALMVSHPIPRKVTFTGSSAVGVKIATSAGADLKRVTLELGGNDPAIVLPDADIEATAGALFDAAFRNCGQGCAAPKRVYVVGDQYENLVSALAARADKTVVGDPLDPDTVIGPCATEAQRAHVESLIADAVDHGARIAAGGHRIERGGYFHQLTVVADVTDGTRVVDEEQFGPVLPVIRCDSVDEAVERANTGMFGLGASVWGSDMPTARAVRERLEAGTVWINAHRAFSAIGQPLGGWKWSGIGTERGVWGLEGMTQVQTLFERN